MGALCIGCTALQPDEQLYLDGCTDQKVINGPGFKVVGFGYSSKLRKGIALKDNDYLIVEDTITGELRRIVGPRLFMPNTYDRMPLVPQRAVSLGPTQYVHVKNHLNGDWKSVKGPALYFPDCYEQVERVQEAVVLQHNEYVKIVDTMSGDIRVEIGEKMVYMEPTEVLLEPRKGKEGVVRAVELDHDTAVLVRDTQTAQLNLLTGNRLFFPSKFQEIVDVQKLIKLADHESIIVKDREGRYSFYSGSEEFEDDDSKHENEVTTRAFFLQPYCEIVTLLWSGGILKEERNVRMTKLDRRPQFMNYEFICRSKDNVELILDVTFFWQIVDVRRMVEFTDDAPGDICHHARSEIIQHVSQVDLEKFMVEFNPIVQLAVLSSNDSFYQQRGVKIHSVEVRQMKCTDASTEKILQQIIQETTNRMNRMQQQASENEVAVFKLKGDIEEEKIIGELLKIKHGHHRDEALMDGQAEADKVNAFLTGLENTVPDIEKRIALFNTLQKVEALKAISGGPAQLYFTPNDIDLSIETVTGAPLQGSRTQKKMDGALVERSSNHRSNQTKTDRGNKSHRSKQAKKVEAKRSAFDDDEEEGDLSD